MIKMTKDIKKIIKNETKRQNAGIELIASENYTSKSVRKLCGSILTNKYAEGYPDARYYGGCKYIDQIERLASFDARILFQCKYANVQPHSGSQANFAAYRAIYTYLKLKRKMKILSVSLDQGGHLTHGSSVSFSSDLYNFNFYSMDKNGKLDYEKLSEAIDKYQPDLLIIGYSSYPYQIDFKAIKELIDQKDNKVMFMVDMAHIAGLVAAGYHQNPCDYADIVTTTTHKTLRGPRGGLILTNNEEISKMINKAVFPYTQGGPLEHIIAAKDQCFCEAMTKEFKTYIKKLMNNTLICRNVLSAHGAVCSPAENHMFLLNTWDSYHLTGAEAQAKLEAVGITTNKNMIPYDTKSPKETSGLRIGFAAVSTRGCSEKDAAAIGSLIHMILSNKIETDLAIDTVRHITKKWKKIERI